MLFRSNAFATLVAKAFGGYGDGGHGYVAVVTMLVFVYVLNLFNVMSLRKVAAASQRR